MPSVEEYLGDRLYANWVKSSLALNITNEVMRPFVQREIIKLHQTILTPLPDGAACTSCIVKTADRCPLGICSHIKSEIMNKHWFPNPSFVNTSVASWCIDPWEIAKCYMPKGERYKNSSAEDADFSTSINVIMNCQHFKSFGTCDPKLTEDKFFKGKKFRNDVMHSKSTKVSDHEMETNLDILIDILKEISTPTIKDNVDHAIREINKIKDNKIILTMEDVLREKKQALEIQGFTPDMIQALITEMVKKGKHLIDEHVQQGKLDIQREKEQVNGTSLIPNFVEGCQMSLRRMTYEHIMNQRPEDTKPEDWKVANFLSNLKLLHAKSDLSARHRDMLFPTSAGTPVDIRDWDIFLFCFILMEFELTVPIENPVKLYVQEVGELRKIFLRDPESVKQSNLMDLCQYVHDADLEKDMTEIFNKTFTPIEVVHSNNILITWDRDDERYSNTQVSQRNLEANKETMLIVDRKITENNKEMNRKLEEMNKMFKNQLEEMKRLLSSKNEEMNEMPSRIEAMNKMSSEIEGLTQQVHKTSGEQNSNKIKSRCYIKTRGCNDETEQAIQEDLTKPDKKDSIGRASGVVDKIEDDMNVEDADLTPGSIILEVTCSSIKGLIDFWDGCMDGRAVKALETARDRYREHFKCSTLEFDVILPKKEVSRCMHQIVEDLPSQLCGKRLIQEVDDIIERLTPKRVDDLPLDLYDEVLLKEVQGMMETEQEETHEDETRDDETHKEESHDEETHEEEILEECDEEETDEEDIHGEETDATETHDEETNDEEILEEETYEEETHEKTDEEETDEEETLEQDTHEEEPNEEDTTLLVRFSAIQDERGFETLREGSQEEETKEDTKEEDTFVVRSDAGIKAIQEGPSAPSPKTKVEGGFGEIEADRLVNFLRQILEDLEGGDVATMKTYLDDIIRHSKENDEKMFYECVRKFLLVASFKSGTSPNLIRQVTRGFNMIQRQPEFGDLVATKLEVIEKEQLEQSAIKASTSGTPIFKQPAGKSTVLIEEDIEVSEMDASRSRPIKSRTEMPGKYHEKEAFKKTTTSMMENPSDTFEMFKTKSRDVAETTSKYPTPKTSYESDVGKWKFDEPGKSGLEKKKKVDDAMTDKSVH